MVPAVVLATRALPNEARFLGMLDAHAAAVAGCRGG
jgi:hypothetical protein